jgi:ABC-2 type transport system permease protein
MQALAKYPAVFRITLASSLVYGRDVLLRSLSMLLVLFVFLQLWTFTFEQQGSGIIQGFTLNDMIWYLVITETVVLSAPRVSLKVDEEVKSGDLAYVLAKPYDYVLYHCAGYWGEAALRLPANFAAGGALALLAVGAPDTDAGGVLAAAVAVVLGLTLNFVIEAMIGLSAFWFEDSQPFFWIYQKFVFMIGGLFIPLDFLPGWLSAVAKYLPFASVTYAPGRLFVDFSWTELVGRVGLQLLWLAIVAILISVVYHKAVRKVSLNGG